MILRPLSKPANLIRLSSEARNNLTQPDSETLMSTTLTPYPTLYGVSWAINGKAVEFE